MTKEQALKIAKPILFNTDMVRAIIDRRKTVTRRVLKPKYTNTQIIIKNGKAFETVGTLATTTEIKPPYQVGDILYVRETWAYVQYMDMSGYVYKASAQAERVVCECANKGKPLKWSPSIHMPKEAARLFLRVTGVRVERLQDITEEQAIHEGIEPHMLLSNRAGTITEYRIPGTCDECPTARGAFFHLWNSTVKKSDLAKYGWAANPWVCVIEFEKVEVS